MPLKVALIGQSAFGVEVFKALKAAGHEIVGVFTVPDNAKTGRADVLAQAAEESGSAVFKFPRWRLKGETIPEVFEAYKSVRADVNVLAFVTQFIPLDVVNTPRLGSICYHPSILPRHRGASAINWTIMSGDTEAGFTIFYPDDGLDTGPILLIRKCKIEPDDTLSSLYSRFLFPEGIKGMVEAVDLLEQGTAPKIPQPEEGASYEPMWKDHSKAQVDFRSPSQTVHDFIRGSDKVPGAWAVVDGAHVTLYGSTRDLPTQPTGATRAPVQVEGAKSAWVTPAGLVITCGDGGNVLVTQVKPEGKSLIQASKLLEKDDGRGEGLGVLTSEEQEHVEHARATFAAILGIDVSDDTDFFESGAGSMDAVRLVATVKTHSKVSIEPTEVQMASRFSAFAQLLVKMLRGGGEEKLVVDYVTVQANDMDVRIPHQLFINGAFVDAVSKETRPTINPTTEKAICEVSQAGEEDVNKAVAAAKAAGANSAPWRRMSARERGKLMYKLADLMQEHQEELATLESLDSGAVYTLALKTHVGMSIDSIRYFAGYCDKISGKVVPIVDSRPSSNLCLVVREPIGVCGMIVPWNYPLMMLAWKMGPCLAAGNTVVLKPANVTPLTALKFAELTALAGFPPGVVNVVPGAGTLVGNALSNHPDVRKIGFTGSTGVGKTIMQACAASNIKRCSLELGGKSALVLFDDCDLDKAVRQSLSAAFFNKGENCIAAGRIFVHRKIVPEFLARATALTTKMVIGDPLDRSTAHGPQNHAAHLDKLLEYIKRGVAEGATLVAGGKRLDRPGYFLQPTIFSDVTDDMWIAQEESFGPIMIILPFDCAEEELLRRVNQLEFALAGGVFTNDINKALRFSQRMEAGTVFVNTYNKTDVGAPFGGFKQSGFGKDLGEEALHDYTQSKTITIEYN